MNTSDPVRRLSPRIWNTDWLMLRKLTRIISIFLSNTVQEGERLLDFGCGTMPYRELVEGRGASYVGADFEGPAPIKIGCDGRLPIDDGSFDTVLSVQVLEHVRDIGKYLSEARRVLKQDGYLLLSTHGVWLYHPHPEDHRRWTRTGLIVDVEAQGFEVKDIVALVGPLATTTMIRLTGYAFVLRRLGMIGRVVSNILAVVMNARGWIEDFVTPTSIRESNGCVYVVWCKKTSI